MNLVIGQAATAPSGSQAALNSSDGSLKELLNRLRSWTHKSDFNSLILISIAKIGIPKVDDTLEAGLAKIFDEVCRRRHAHKYRLSKTDTALLIRLRENNKLDIIADLKVDLMNMMQRDLPEHFGSIDQTRLVRVIDLATRLHQTIRFMETYMDRARLRGESADGSRPLRADDVEKLREAQMRLGSTAFAKSFVRRQNIALIAPGKPILPMFDELYVSVQALREILYPGVDFRGASNAFNELTLAMDEAMLGCFRQAATEGRKCTLNLNVESIFTNAFERFLTSLTDAGLASVMIEFRQDDILKDVARYEEAAEMIRSLGGGVAIDAIFCETVGLVNLELLKPSMAKIFWRPSMSDRLLEHKDTVKRLQDSGVVLVLARVDNQTGIDLGQTLGFTLFQGFHVDQEAVG